MPKQTFFNLPGEKQENLISSAKREFSRVPLNEASISNIVKNAGIPRGSFYQYFEDKEDAFYYLLEKQMEVHRSDFFSVLERNHGDLFASFIEVFKHMLIEFQDKGNRDFFRNVFLNMNYKMEKKLIHGYSKGKFDEQFSEIIFRIDMKKLNIGSEQEIIHVVEIMVAVTTHNLMQSFAKQHSFEKAMEIYILEMNLLKKGLYRDHE